MEDVGSAAVDVVVDHDSRDVDWLRAMPSADVEAMLERARLILATSIRMRMRPSEVAI